jgi:hypothetical protein
LAAASELFYAEGVQSVGIDRVIEHAGVAKATLYSAFGSKEELVRVQGLSFTDPGFRGCAFVGAKAEARPGGAVHEVADEYRAWLHGLFTGLAREAGATIPRASPSSSCCSTTARESAPGWTAIPVSKRPPARLPPRSSAPLSRTPPAGNSVACGRSRG